MTNRQAIRIALSIAIDEENSLIDAYASVTDGSGLEAITAAKGNIKAFRRVLQRHFGDKRSSVERMLAGTRPVSIQELISRVDNGGTP